MGFIVIAMHFCHLKWDAQETEAHPVTGFDAIYLTKGSSGDKEKKGK